MPDHRKAVSSLFSSTTADRARLSLYPRPIQNLPARRRRSLDPACRCPVLRERHPSLRTCVLQAKAGASRSSLGYRCSSRKLPSRDRQRHPVRDIGDRAHAHNGQRRGRGIARIGGILVPRPVLVPDALEVGAHTSSRSVPPQADRGHHAGPGEWLGSPHSRVATDSTDTHRNVTRRLSKDFTGIARDSTGTPDSTIFRTVRNLADLSRGFYRQTLIQPYK